MSDYNNLAKRSGIQHIQVVLSPLRLCVRKWIALVTWASFQSVKKSMSQQREDGNLTEEAINYIENGTCASDCPANRKRSIRKKAGKLALREGEVYYTVV